MNSNISVRYSVINNEKTEKGSTFLHAAGEAEVAYLKVAVRVDEEVRGLDVAVKDRCRMQKF
tara:strand:- start:359 stop:544 length:186 start_codon:yes stop_codon:yes gene_type:complete